MKEFASGRKPLNDPQRYLEYIHLFYDDEPLENWKEHFLTVLNRKASVEIPPIVDNMANNRMIWTTPQNRNEIVYAISALKRTVSRDIFHAPLAVSALLFTLICKSWESQTFHNVSESICMFLLSWRYQVKSSRRAKRAKENFKSLVEIEQVSFYSAYICTGHIDTLRVIMEQREEFKSPLYLLYVDFEKAFESINT